MLDRALNAIPPGAHIFLADPNTITTKAQHIGEAILAVTLIVALVAAFFTQDQRRWMVVGSILLIGGFTFMIVSDPTALMSQVGTFIKDNVWTPIMT